MYFKETIQKAN